MVYTTTPPQRLHFGPLPVSTTGFALNMKRGLPPRDKGWFSTPIVELLETLSSVEKEQWLASVDGARIRWVRRRDQSWVAMSRSRQALRNWLAAPPPQHTPA